MRQRNYNYDFLVNGAIPAEIVRRLLYVHWLEFSTKVAAKDTGSREKALKRATMEQSMREYADMTGSKVRESTIRALAAWDEDEAVNRALSEGYANTDGGWTRWQCIRAFLAGHGVETTEASELCLYGLLIKSVNKHWSSWQVDCTTIQDMHRRLFPAVITANGNWEPLGGEYRSPALETERELRSALDAYTAAAGKIGGMSLLLAICFIKDFWVIQPFPDGNSRVTRLLMRLLLLQCGFNVWQHVSLERLIRDHEYKYRKDLVDSAQKGYWDFAGVCLSMLEDSYAGLNQALERLHQFNLSKTKRIESYVTRVTEPVSKAQICAAMPDISVTMVEKVLGCMVKERRIAIRGKGRAVKYLGTADAADEPGIEIAPRMRQ